MEQLQLLEEVKNNKEDFEWYPTTKEILKDLHKSLISEGFGQIKMLDIGAGNGKVFKELKNINGKINPDKVKAQFKNNVERFGITGYAIEKSKTLIRSLDKDIFVIGTDFLNQSLIDKKMDVIFCNPPYSEYQAWVTKILSEANSDYVYLVIPERWINSKEIDVVIKRRDLEYKVIGKYDFINSEDRKARAKVNLIKFRIKTFKYYEKFNSRYEKYVDPFDLWFENHFKIAAEKTKTYDYEKAKQKENELKNKLMRKESFIKELVKLYNIDLKQLINNYKALENLDAELLEELGANLESLKKGLKEKIENLKNLYWRTLFDNLDAITRRLTQKSRESMMSTLFAHTNIDLTENNIYALIIWVIKNANKYFDKQLLDIYFQFANKNNIKLYKSNKRIVNDYWRYNASWRNQDNVTHYTLDYRLITSIYNTFPEYQCETINGLGKCAWVFIKDIMIIGINLGFNLNLADLNMKQWNPGKSQEFYINGELFMECKAYKNGNIHFRLNKKFMKKLNIEAARLNKWVKSPQDIVKEFADDISLSEVKQHFQSNFAITGGVKAILG